MKRTLLFLSALLTSIPLAHAQNIALGEPTYGGSGCPGGTAAVALSSDRTTLSILYDQYQASAGGTTGRSFDRKTCNLAIPISVPQGISVSIVSIDYRGFNDIPAGGSSVFRVEYFFAGGTGPVFNRTFNGPLSDDFLIRNELIGTNVVWSACGDDVILRTNSSLRVNTAQNRQAVATVDTEDVSAALIFHVRWRSC